jgi:hypothetical protein
MLLKRISSKKQHMCYLITYTNIIVLASAAETTSRRARHCTPCHADTTTAKFVYGF